MNTTRSNVSRLGRPRAISALVVPLFWACSLLFGCEQPGPRVYTAMPFDPELQCFHDYVPLGLVDAEDLPATCEPVCLLRDDRLYVSPVCAPFPAEASLVAPETSADCAAALVAWGLDSASCEVEPP